MQWFFVLLTLLWLCIPTHVQALEPLFSDNFDHGLSWVLVRNAALNAPSGTCLTREGVPQWHVVDGAVEFQIDGSVPCITEIIPNNQDIADKRAFAVTFRMFISSPKMDRNLLVRWKDSRNRIGIHLFDSYIAAEKMIEGKSYRFQNGEGFFRFERDRWYDVSLEYDLSSRQLKLEINGERILLATELKEDPQLTEGSPGLSASVGEVNISYVRFDNFQVHSLESGKILSVEPLKQTDPQWGNNPYDSAQDWSPSKPTIGRWGCALTAGVAVLRYHGVRTLPNASSLDPGSLNSWLKDQPDGYLPGGSINWRALTRLSWWHKQEFGTPALEMSYENPSDKIGWLASQIIAEKPVILAEPGHFVTAYGTGPGAQDIAIHDPFFKRFRLDDYQGTYTSARLFTPSHTDLSAITILATPQTRLRLIDNQGEELLPVKIPEFPLTDPETGQGGQPSTLYDLPKPPEYVNIAIESDTLTPLWIGVYTSTGEATTKEAFLPPGLQTISIVIKDGEVKISALPKPQPLLLSELAGLYSAKFLRNAALVDVILRHQDQLEQASSLSSAEAVERGLSLLLRTAAVNHWLSLPLSQQLLGHFHHLLLEKFP